MSVELDGTGSRRVISPIVQAELRELQQRSDAQGLARFAAHLAAIGGSLALYALAIARAAPWPVVVLGAVTYGFTLVTMFACMHETVHRTAFKTRWLNDAASWLAGLLSFYNSTFFRHFHGWHHRFTQIDGKDPERDERRPDSLPSYLLALSGLPWWLGKLETHFGLALGKTAPYPYLNERNRAEVVRSVRLQLLTYAVAIALSVALGYPYFVVYWLLPVAAGQPLLRAILLAEHIGCAENDDALANTRTTYTVLPVRFLMWQMPFHAEHHRYPALPFFVLAKAHEQLGPHLVHVERRGYLGVHAALLRRILQSD